MPATLSRRWLRRWDITDRKTGEVQKVTLRIVKIPKNFHVETIEDLFSGKQSKGEIRKAKGLPYSEFDQKCYFIGDVKLQKGFKPKTPFDAIPAKPMHKIFCSPSRPDGTREQVFEECLKYNRRALKNGWRTWKVALVDDGIQARTAKVSEAFDRTGGAFRLSPSFHDDGRSGPMNLFYSISQHVSFECDISQPIEPQLLEQAEAMFAKAIAPLRKAAAKYRKRKGGAA